MTNTSSGNCYICGKELGKTARKNHIVKSHNDPEGDQRCFLLKIEGVYDRSYWLFIDVPLDKTLSTVDTFLRDIWLECCGHLSAFRIGRYDEIGKSRKLNTFSIGDKLLHEYDFGTPTESLITVVAEVSRKKQRNAVRLLARNVPPDHRCSICGEPADVICCECMYESDDPFFCEECAEKHEEEHDMMLDVANSPRMGECGYGGDLAEYVFDPKKIKE
ncbi:MAG: hypothetical protein LBB91_11390 [Clostridiales bacterium]|jgi:hypothetical protein|nr:hypothetical protein [Clostridiales bacterium]